MLNTYSKPLFFYPNYELPEGRDSFSYFLGLEMEELSEQSGQAGRNLVAGTQAECQVSEGTVCDAMEYKLLRQCRARWQRF